jgi:hypothetical protein
MSVPPAQQFEEECGGVSHRARAYMLDRSLIGEAAA